MQAEKPSEEAILAAWRAAADGIAALDRLSPERAKAMICNVRNRLRLNDLGDSLPLFVEVAVRVELANALYAELDGHHTSAAQSYANLLRWFERIGVCSEAHVDGLIAAYSWGVLNDQAHWVRRVDRVIDRAVAKAEVSEVSRAVMREQVSSWRVRAQRRFVLQERYAARRDLTVREVSDAEPSLLFGGPEADALCLRGAEKECWLEELGEGLSAGGAAPVVDFHRFADVILGLAIDVNALAACESQARALLFGKEDDASVRRVGAVAALLGFTEAFRASRALLEGKESDRHLLSMSLADAFSTARRQLAS